MRRVVGITAGTPMNPEALKTKLTPDVREMVEKVVEQEKTIIEETYRETIQEVVSETVVKEKETIIETVLERVPEAIEVPTFDLNEMGLGQILANEHNYVENVDCSALMEALGKGLVRLKSSLTYEGESFSYSNLVTAGYIEELNLYTINLNCTTFHPNNENPVVPWQGIAVVGENFVYATIMILQKALPTWTGGSY